ncbi:MAG: alpha-ribazole phosphatase family protein [Alphaproteobacteria bacterium]|nr:alpha-ribazole phosphatase family protein [Alphaproteobacteria bacterium]MDE2494647.1 alpha-ribazole phosphatase family protein [Alphaproteobacteria bacterium]
MSPPVICFLRHGETEGGVRYWGHTDVALTARGMQQMREATSGHSYDRIVSSPLVRCRTFAEDLSLRDNLAMHVEPRFAEMDFGRWSGRDTAEIMANEADALCRFWQDPVRHPPPGGETLGAVAARVLAACRDLIGGTANRRTLVVTHGGPIRVLLCLLQGLPINRALKIEVPHASLHNICPGELARFCATVEP